VALLGETRDELGASEYLATVLGRDEGPCPVLDLLAVKNLVDLFRTWERLLPAIRHYGWAHPEADGKLRATYQKVIEALRADSAAVWWKLSPYSFVHRGQTVWEPPAPLDVVPYHLFAAGIRKIGSAEPMQVQDQVHLGSNTKAMTAFLCGILVDEGKLKWNQPLGETFPEWAYRNPSMWSNERFSSMSWTMWLIDGS